MKLSISGSVGKNAKNTPADIKLIQALLNTYHRRNNHATLDVSGKSNGDLIEAINRFQRVEQSMAKPDGKITSTSSQTFLALVRFMKSTRSRTNITTPKRGALTWKAEGNEGGPFHSRVLHVPSPASGLTIGRGYDMRNRSSAEIRSHLQQANIPSKYATKISEGAGLFGPSAERFIIEQDLLDHEISAESQLKLFESIYKDYVATVKRICASRSVVATYGETDWENLDLDILEIVVDMTFRGDYHVNSRKIIQKSIAGNDFEVFKKLITERSNWGNWPPNRFSRRKAYLLDASKRKRKINSVINQFESESAKYFLPKLTGTPQ